MHLTTFCVVLLMAVRNFAGILKHSHEVTQLCHCVSKHMCMENDRDVDIKDLVDIRTLDVKCENKSDVCCRLPRHSPIHNVLLEVSDQLEEPEVTEIPVFDSCGYEITLAERVIGGKLITSGELPWTTAILFREDKFWKFLCGGSIIHPQVVLTAAHCVYEYEVEILRVRAGEIDNESDFEPYPHQDSLITYKVVHPKFHPESLKNDLALLFLKDPFVISPNINIICLPSGDLLSRILPNCQSGGYGVDGIDKVFTGKQLRKSEIPLVPRYECVSKLRKTILGEYFNLDRSFVCAGGTEYHDTCKGDGGGALACPMLNQPNRYIQVGIVSWGIGCGTGVPGIYTNVNLYIGWIDEQMSRRNLDISINKYI